ncbi:hypothetical protein Hanom_Chr03g00194141 [Helianthus anomalus]
MRWSRSGSRKGKAEARKVLVVCFLCTNRQLEHAHFIEVALTSSEGFFKTCRCRFGP